MIWRLEPSEHITKVNVGARQAGINKRKKPSSQTNGNNQGKPPKLRVACPECPLVNGYPVYTYVQKKDRKAVCKSGHMVDCSGGCKLAS